MEGRIEERRIGEDKREENLLFLLDSPAHISPGSISGLQEQYICCARFRNRKSLALSCVHVSIVCCAYGATPRTLTDLSLVRVSILLHMRQTYELTCSNGPPGETKITLGSSDTWPFFFFLRESEESQREQFIKTKQEDAEWCCQGVMTDVLGLQKGPQNKGPFLCMQKQYQNAKMPFECLWAINARQLIRASLEARKEKYPHSTIWRLKCLFLGW